MAVYRPDILFLAVVISFVASSGEYLSYFQVGPIPPTTGGFKLTGGFVSLRESEI